MTKAFSLLELFVVIILSGVMAIFALSYINPSSISKQSIKTELQSHLNSISATILQCKELSNRMPIQTNGSYASGTLLDTLECNTTTPYALDGGKGSFIPPPPSGFTDYTATQNSSVFFVSTTAAIDSINDEVLQELNSSYSTKQYELDYNTTTVSMKFYLSR